MSEKPKFHIPADVTHTRGNPDGIVCFMRQHDHGAEVVGYMNPFTGQFARGNPPSIAELRRAWLQLQKQTSLQFSLVPRLLDRVDSARYVCVSPNTFDEMVENGRMPKPKMPTERRRAWDIWELNKAVDALPKCGDDSRDDSSWDDVDAA
jgi:hypothetical protein